MQACRYPGGPVPVPVCGDGEGGGSAKGLCRKFGVTLVKSSLLPYPGCTSSVDVVSDVDAFEKKIDPGGLETAFVDRHVPPDLQGAVCDNVAPVCQDNSPVGRHVPPDLQGAVCDNVGPGDFESDSRFEETQG